MKLWVEQLSANDKDLWNAWVSSHPLAHFYHLWEWGDILSATYSYNRFYLVAKCDGDIVGALPLIHIPSTIFQNKLVSLPFCEYGGPLIDKSLSSSAADTTIKLFIKTQSKLAQKMRVKYIEIRHPSLSLSEFGLQSLERYLTFQVNLTHGEEETWRNLDKKCRNAIRRAMKSGIKTTNIDNRNLKHYFALYLDTERRFGAPPHSEKLFSRLLDVLKEKRLMQMVLAVFDGEPIGGIIIFCFNGKMYWWNNVNNRDFSRLNPTNLLLWHIIQWGMSNNFKILDLGRTRLETRGIYHFKSSWGGERVPLKDYVLTNRGVSLPDPLQRRYSILSRVWSMLPSSLARRIGPRVVKDIGL